MVMTNNRIKHNLFLLISSFSYFFLCMPTSSLGLFETPFKCTLDGLFEDENDCRMYYECLWIGTAFEKQEHLKCAESLIYNPRKHRCDDINEFESQFANGVQTGEELLEFMRFRNCVGFKSLIDGGMTSNTLMNESHAKKITFDLLNGKHQIINSSKPLFSPKSNSNKDNPNKNFLKSNQLDLDETTTTKKSSNTTESAKINNIFTETYLTNKHLLNETKNQIKLEKKRPFLKEFKQDHKPRTRDLLSSHKKIENDFLVLNKRRSHKISELKRYDHLKKLASQINERFDTNDYEKHSGPRELKPAIQFLGRKLLSINDNEIDNEEDEAETVINNEDDELTTMVDDEELDSSKDSRVLRDKDEVLHEFTSQIMRDFDSNNHKRTNKSNGSSNNKSISLIDTIEQRLSKRGKSNTIVGKEIITNQTSKFILKSNNSSNSQSTSTVLTLIAKAEPLKSSMDDTRYSRIQNDLNESGEYSADSKEKKLLNKIQAKLLYGYLKNSSIPSMILSKILENDPNNPVFSAIKNPLKLIKLLPKLNNESSVITEDKLDMYLDSSERQRLDTLLEHYLNEMKMRHKNGSIDYDDMKILKDVETDMFTTNKPSTNSSTASTTTTTTKTTTHTTTTTLSTTSTTKTSTSTTTTTTTTTSSSTTSTTKKTSTQMLTTTSTSSKMKLASVPTVNSFYATSKTQNSDVKVTSINSQKPKKSSESSIFTEPLFEPITTFKPLKTNSKRPDMQTYRINQTKKLPNQFASLKLNYEKPPSIQSQSTSSSSITKIDEVERGGKFQRLRIAPTDTLIECKENDFGLECSCSITLSPPKCKQLINSFLSSCRILGCKNNGRCINMAYKYPIPYVCSCPGAFMGTYCEIPRDQTVENDMSMSTLSKPKAIPDWLANLSPKFLQLNNEYNQAVTSKPPLLNTPYVKSSQARFDVSTFTPVDNYQINIQNVTSSSPQINFYSTFTLSRLVSTPKPIEFKEPLCEPNPCKNKGKCSIMNDSFVCQCLNGSFTGRYCENIITNYLQQMPAVKTGNFNSQPTSLKPGYDFISKPPNVFSLPANKQETSSPTPAQIVEQSTRRYFWQCPSNCLYHLGHGYCALSQSGFPSCVCRKEFTGIDCSQQNYCLNNLCSNNSTCFNYPETKSYLCICSKGYTGRTCDVDLSYLMESKQKPQVKSLLTNLNEISFENKHRTSTPTVQSTSLSMHPCLSEKCKNNGSCVMSFSNAKNQFSFVCKCANGFYGPLCEYRENACVPNPCREPEKNECVPLGFQKYECVCGRNCKKPAVMNKVEQDLFSNRNVNNRLPPFARFNINNLRNNINKYYQSKQQKIAHDEIINSKLIKSQPPSSQQELRGKEKDEPNMKSDIAFDKNFNPCNNDPNLCLKYPYGNESFICVKSFLTQDYTLCLPTRTINCKQSNPCLNSGLCIENEKKSNKINKEASWKCLCPNGFTGFLCETEICSPVHKLFANHTMCLADSPNLGNVYEKNGVSSLDMDLILDMHNTLRRQVAPIAANMQKMYWDVRLQNLAQKRSQLCSVDNTGILMRQQPGYGVVIGENLAAGYEKWSDVLTSWMSEKKHFIFKSTSPQDNLQAGHYTQMIYSSASRIGCGFSQCSNTTYDRYFVCYYGEMQTYVSRYEPYQDGKQCSQCGENNCDNGLCDCNGAFCSNGGTMDLKTCTCTCPYSTFTGRYCENVICPKDDSPFCSHTLFEDKCWLYPVVRASCPYMCSLCMKYTPNFNDNSTLPTHHMKQTKTSFNPSVQDIINSIKRN